jgi:hypothetical protein
MGPVVPNPSNPYLDLTREFNHGRLRAVISSGQAVVLHRLAVMSKDGDWIIREDAEATEHLLGVLESRGARYRFSAPLDLRWLRGGWSCHFEHVRAGIRLRTDFASRPPRVPPTDLQRMWSTLEGVEFPVVDARTLALIKMTDREKDWPVIGELARLLDSPRDRLTFSRSPRDILALLRRHPEIVSEAIAARPALAAWANGEEALGAALDAERRAAMRVNEARLATYASAARAWKDAWPEVENATRMLPLRAAHRTIVARAESRLPFEVARDG